jgi:hypothetical protein
MWYIGKMCATYFVDRVFEEVPDRGLYLNALNTTQIPGWMVGVVCCISSYPSRTSVLFAGRLKTSLAHWLPLLEIDNFCTFISFVKEYICLQIFKLKEMTFLRKIIRKRSFGTDVLRRTIFYF